MSARLLLSLGLTFACLWWTFRDTEWEAMWASLAAARWILLLPYTIILAAVHLVRALRWGHLLAVRERIRLRELHEATAIGAMLLYILPMRLGELARPVLVAQRSSIRAGEAMSAVALERIADGLVVALLARVLLMTIPADAPRRLEIELASDLLVVAFGGGSLVLMLAAHQHVRALAMLERALRPLPRPIGERVAPLVAGFIDALRQPPGRHDLVAFVAWTAVLWILLGASVVLLTRAFDCSSALSGVCAPLDLSLAQALFVLCALTIGSMVPLAPGGAGTSQVAALIALSVFVPDEIVRASGVAWANVQWLAPLVFQVALGIVVMVATHRTVRTVRDDLQRAPEGPR